MSNTNEKCNDDKIKINDYISINTNNLKHYLHIGWEKLCDIYVHKLIKQGHEYVAIGVAEHVNTPESSDTTRSESDVMKKERRKSQAIMMRNHHKPSTHALPDSSNKSEAKYAGSDHYIQECLLENLGSLRKLIIHRLFCNVVEAKEKNEQCYNEYMAMGSTNITSDYDLTIKGSTSNDVMWNMFTKFIELYNVTLPYAFDTNLYSSPFHLFKQPECLNSPKQGGFINSNLKNQSYYLEYDNKNFTFVPTTTQEIDVELQFAFLKLYEAMEEEENSNKSNVYPTIKKYINEAINLGLSKKKTTQEIDAELTKLGLDEIAQKINIMGTNETVKQNKLNKNKRLLLDYKKQYDAQTPVQQYIYTSGDKTYDNKGADLFKNSNTANYWSSEAYYTSSACNTIIIDIQMNKGKPYMLNKYRKKKIPDDIIKKIYLCSAIENLADMIHHIDNNLHTITGFPTLVKKDDVMLTLIKFSKYLYRFYYSIEAPNLTEWNHNEPGKGNYKITTDNKGKEKIKIIKGLTHSILLKDNLIPRRKDQNKEKAKEWIDTYFFNGEMQTLLGWKSELKKGEENVAKSKVISNIKSLFLTKIERILNGNPNWEPKIRNTVPAKTPRSSGFSASGGKKRTKKKARKKRRRKRSKKRRK